MNKAIKIVSKAHHGVPREYIENPSREHVGKFGASIYDASGEEDAREVAERILGIELLSDIISGVRGGFLSYWFAPDGRCVGGYDASQDDEGSIQPLHRWGQIPGHPAK